MELNKFINPIYNYVKGFIEVNNYEVVRYSFIIEKLEITYREEILKTLVHYTPIGCYRVFKNYVSELNDKIVCRKFKPEHARMIIGIHTLESTLDFLNKKQTESYLSFVKSCNQSL